MELIEIARTSDENCLDLFVEGNTEELAAYMMKNCKVEEKPFKPMGYDSATELSADRILFDRDGMDEELILVKRIF